jgi:hypothetical protein
MIVVLMSVSSGRILTIRGKLFFLDSISQQKTPEDDLPSGALHQMVRSGFSRESYAP